MCLFLLIDKNIKKRSKKVMKYFETFTKFKIMEKLS